MDPNFAYVVGICVVAFFFDFINGFHDAANSIATVVSTRVLRPTYAVVWAAFFNFAAFFLFGVHVAEMVGSKLVDPQVITNELILAALIGAVVWDLLTWYLGLPTSSSHALIGGLAGAAWVQSGTDALILPGLVKVAAFIVLSPLIGLVLGFAARTVVSRLFWHSSPKTTARQFRRLQLLSAALYSLGHGTNDAQKTMGIVAVLLFANGYLGSEFSVPTWVVLTAHAAIALGTMAGGWRIIKTMGMRITKLQPVDGFCAETSAAVALFATARAGIPVSTTHTITGAIVGVGSTRRLSAVRWGVTINVVWAWVLTIPGSMIVAAAARRAIPAPVTRPAMRTAARPWPGRRQSRLRSHLRLQLHPCRPRDVRHPEHDRARLPGPPRAAVHVLDVHLRRRQLLRRRRQRARLVRQLRDDHRALHHAHPGLLQRRSSLRVRRRHHSHHAHVCPVRHRHRLDVRLRARHDRRHSRQLSRLVLQCHRQLRPACHLPRLLGSGLRPIFGPSPAPPASLRSHDVTSRVSCVANIPCPLPTGPIENTAERAIRSSPQAIGAPSASRCCISQNKRGADALHLE